MKLCKDCKYCEPVVSKFLWITSINYKYAKCKSNKAANLIDGSGGSYCNIERTYDSLPDKCGREGRHWEAK